MLQRLSAAAAGQMWQLQQHDISHCSGTPRGLQLMLFKKASSEQSQLSSAIANRRHPPHLTDRAACCRRSCRSYSCKTPARESPNSPQYMTWQGLLKHPEEQPEVSRLLSSRGGLSLDSVGDCGCLNCSGPSREPTQCTETRQRVLPCMTLSLATPAAGALSAIRGGTRTAGACCSIPCHCWLLLFTGGWALHP